MTDSYRFGPFELDPRTADLRRDGEPVPLQLQPARILVLLVERAGALVSREAKVERRSGRAAGAPPRRRILAFTLAGLLLTTGGVAAVSGVGQEAEHQPAEPENPAAREAFQGELRVSCG